MADIWELVTPTGSYTLNPTFSAPQYQPGGGDTNALLRREGRDAFQRAGDGLPTPGPLRLTGRVWRDDRDTALIVTELNAIRDAVMTCTEVARVTPAGTYRYTNLAGGPSPAVTPDGLGGWVVEIEVWPGRAEPAFVPAQEWSDPTTLVQHQSIEWSSGLGGVFGFEFLTSVTMRVMALRAAFAGPGTVTVYLAALPFTEALVSAEVPAGDSGWAAVPVDPVTLPPGAYMLWVDTHIVRSGRDWRVHALVPGAQYVQAYSGGPGNTPPTNPRDFPRQVDAVVETLLQ